MPDASMLTIRAKGSHKDQGRVRLHDFIAVLSAVRASLNEVAESVLFARSPTAYRVVGLRASSAEVDLQPVGEGERDWGTEAIEAFVNGLDDLEHGRVPERFDFAAFSAVRRLSSVFEADISSLMVATEHRQVEVSPLLGQNVDRLLAQPDAERVGSLSGHLDAVNVHRDNVFYLYPPVGPPRVKCSFPEPLIDEIKGAIGAYAEVRGTVLYRAFGRYPHRVEVEAVRVPEEPRTSLRSLRGIAPELTDGIDSVSFVRRLRDAS